MRVTCERCLRRYDVPDATVKGRKIRARCKCGARVVVQDEERAAQSLAAGSQTTGSIQRPVRWFVDITSWEPIAMDLRQLVRAFDAGRVDADTLVWRKGMPDWRRLRDVSELAERLLGGAGASDAAGGEARDSAGNNDKRVSEPPPAEAAQAAFASGSEPPPRQSERSRTPPASYTVGHRSSERPLERSRSEAPRSEAPAAHLVAARTGSEPAQAAPDRVSVPPAGDNPKGAPLSRSAGPRSTPSPAPHSGAPRPASRRGRGKTPSRPNAAPLNPRTVTQTGLESPAEVAARHSSPPPGPADAPDAGRASVSPGASASRARDSRSGTPPAGVRRPVSSDETPAQKPSSLSVPPGALVNATARPRGRRLLALAAVALGGVFMFRQLTRDDAGSPTAQHTAEAVNEPRRVENALAPQASGTQPERAATLPVPEQRAAELGASQRTQAAPASVASTGTAVEGKRAAGNVTLTDADRNKSSDGAGVSSSGSSPARGGVTSGGVMTGVLPPSPEASAEPSVSAMAPASSAEHAPNVEASAKESLGAAPPVRALPPAPARPAVVPPAVATAPRPTAPRPTAAPRPAPAPESPPVPRPARPFDEDLATRQFELATAQAARCNDAGSTRGIGRVKVSIEPWGRVGRVTHLTQDFVGTGVGLCVMQAFQQIQVPAFDGNSRSIAGEFAVE